MILAHRLFVFLAACIVLTGACVAQQYPFTRYGTADGLAQNYITSITQDYRGFLWVGTGDAGVSRFDGREFVSFDSYTAGLPSAITALATFGTQFLFVGSTDGVRCIRLGSTLDDKADSAVNRRIERIRGPIREMYMRNHQELYIGGVEYAWMFSLRDSTLKLSPMLPPRHGYLAASIPDAVIRGMSRDCDKRLWLATDKGLVLHDDAGSIAVDKSNGLIVDDVLCVHCDDEGNVWAGTVDGLFKHTVSRIINFLPGRELSPDARGVWSILSTREDVVWLGTIGGGLTRLFSGERRTYRKKDGLPSDNVSSLLELPNGDILVGTDNGLAVITGDIVISMAKRIPLPDQRVEALLLGRDSRYWIATHNGLAVWNGEGSRIYTTADGLPSNRISAIAEDKQGFLWIGTHEGVARINLRSGNVLNVCNIGGIRVSCIFIDQRDRQWFGTAGSGVVCRRDGNDVTSIASDDGLAGNTVYFIGGDAHGSLYFGTNMGISVLPATYVDYLVEERDMRFSGGIDPAIVKAEQRSQALHTLGTRNGLAGDEMNSGAVFRDGKHRLWFGAIGGVSCFQPTKPPTLTYWSFPECGKSSNSTGRQRIWLTELYINDTLTQRRGTLELGPTDRILQLRLNSPSFRNAGEVRFLYKLEGLHYGWHSSEDGRILFAAIPPGTYTLLARATLGEGHWTPIYQMLTVRVAPPFTGTIWFWLLLLLLAAAVGAALMYWRSRKQLEMERMRIHIASDLHDDIGASLGTISLLSDLERRRAGAAESKNLESIGHLARRCVQDMSDIVWSVNPSHDSMQGLIGRLRETAEELSRASGITIDVQAEATRPELRVGAGDRRALMLIAKEALFNAVRHSGASRITLRLTKERSTMLLLVRDDGHGFNTTVTAAGNGIPNMQRRAEASGWTVDISSTAGGTDVALRFYL